MLLSCTRVGIRLNLSNRQHVFTKLVTCEFLVKVVTVNIACVNMAPWSRDCSICEVNEHYRANALDDPVSSNNHME
jgi:hypothetical protein